MPLAGVGHFGQGLIQGHRPERFTNYAARQGHHGFTVDSRSMLEAVKKVGRDHHRNPLTLSLGVARVCGRIGVNHGAERLWRGIHSSRFYWTA